MKLSDLFETLSYGELSNLSIGNNGNGTITEAAKPKIVNMANDGLIRLYSKFNLLEKNIFVQTVDFITEYKLEPRYAVNYGETTTDESADQRYILDTPSDPFLGDIIKILAVFDEHGHKLPLNDEEHRLSLFTPKVNVLQVPNPDHMDMLSVQYQARHKKLTGDEDQEIHLPEVLVGALTAYIGYKIYSGMNSQENSAKAQEHLAIYQSLCRDVTETDLVNSSISTSNVKFHWRGWV